MDAATLPPFFRDQAATVRRSARALCVRLVTLVALLLLVRHWLPPWLLQTLLLAAAALLYGACCVATEHVSVVARPSAADSRTFDVQLSSRGGGAWLKSCASFVSVLLAHGVTQRAAVPFMVCELLRMHPLRMTVPRQRAGPSTVLLNFHTFQDIVTRRGHRMPPHTQCNWTHHDAMMPTRCSLCLVDIFTLFLHGRAHQHVMRLDWLGADACLEGFLHGGLRRLGLPHRPKITIDAPLWGAVTVPKRTARASEDAWWEQLERLRGRPTPDYALVVYARGNSLTSTCWHRGDWRSGWPWRLSADELTKFSHTDQPEDYIKAGSPAQDCRAHFGCGPLYLAAAMGWPLTMPLTRVTAAHVELTHCTFPPRASGQSAAALLTTPGPADARALAAQWRWPPPFRGDSAAAFAEWRATHGEEIRRFGRLLHSALLQYYDAISRARS
jgi:hypothetical protein